MEIGIPKSRGILLDIGEQIDFINERWDTLQENAQEYGEVLVKALDVSKNEAEALVKEIIQIEKHIRALAHERSQLSGVEEELDQAEQRRRAEQIALINKQIEVTRDLHRHKLEELRDTKSTMNVVKNQIGLTRKSMTQDKQRVHIMTQLARQYRWFQSLILVTLNFLRVVSGVSPVLGAIMSMLGTGLGYILNVILIPLIPLFVWILRGLIWIGKALDNLNKKFRIWGDFGLGSLLGLIAIAIPAFWGFITTLGVVAWSTLGIKGVMEGLGITLGALKRKIGSLGLGKLATKLTGLSVPVITAKGALVALGKVGLVALAGLAAGFVLWKLGVVDAIHKVNYAIMRFLLDIPRMVGEVFNHVRDVGIIRGMIDIIALLFSYAVEFYYIGLAWTLDMVAGFIEFLPEIPEMIMNVLRWLRDTAKDFYNIGIEWGRSIVDGIVEEIRELVRLVPYLGERFAGIMGLDRRPATQPADMSLRGFSDYFRGEAERVRSYRDEHMPLGGLFPSYTDEERRASITYPGRLYQPMDDLMSSYIPSGTSRGAPEVVMGDVIINISGDSSDYDRLISELPDLIEEGIVKVFRSGQVAGDMGV